MPSCVILHKTRATHFAVLSETDVKWATDVLQYQIEAIRTLTGC